MDKKKIKIALKKLKKDELIELIFEIYTELSENKQYEFFNSFYEQETKIYKNPKKIYEEITKFYNDSLNKVYYAPFFINSKNFSEIPEETELWCNKISNYFEKSINLVDHGQYEYAFKCFTILYYLEENMCEEIVFADELGSWMIPINHSKVIPKYIIAAKEICDPIEYKKIIVKLIERNDYDYNKTKVFNKAIKIGTKDQKKILKEIKPASTKKRKTGTTHN